MTNADKTINIVHLYAEDMNVYGDHGNVLALTRRLERYGYKSVVIEYNPGMEFPKDVDIIIGGGGQDSGQIIIQDDLLKIAPTLKELATTGTPILVVCGLYQLFGSAFHTSDGIAIKGAGIFDLETKAGATRLTGNVTTVSQEFGTIIGYENHSGKTTLGKTAKVLGHVRLGAGNNGVDVTEGVIFNNTIGTYLHGPLLPKNPTITDFLIKTAIKRKFNIEINKQLDDTLVDKAREYAIKRPR